MERIRIFTDGGAFRKDNKKSKTPMFDSVSSYRIYKDDTLLNQKQEVHIDKTNNYAEIYSIATALENVQEYLETAKPEEFTIELFSDSELCVKSLNIWIFNWIKKADENGTFYNSTGVEVANQELIKRAFKVKKKYFKVTTIYHINSHVQASELKSLYKKFLKYNKCKMKYEDFTFAYLQNNNCDKVIKPVYTEFIKNNLSKNKNIDKNK